MTAETVPPPRAPGRQEGRRRAGADSAATEAVRALARASRLLERASDELNLAQYRVLAAIASGNERASRIATRLALGKPAVSVMVESLRQRGLLERSAVEGDQRGAVLTLTDQGRATLERVEAAMASRLQDACDRSPSPGVLEALVALGAAVEELAAERHRRRGP